MSTTATTTFKHVSYLWNEAEAAKLAGVQAVAQSGKLFNAVSQNGLATPMPPNGKLPACDIQRIRVWISEGIKNN